MLFASKIFTNDASGFFWGGFSKSIFIPSITRILHHGGSTIHSHFAFGLFEKWLMLLHCLKFNEVLLAKRKAHAAATEINFGARFCLNLERARKGSEAPTRKSLMPAKSLKHFNQPSFAHPRGPRAFGARFLRSVKFDRRSCEVEILNVMLENFHKFNEKYSRYIHWKH